MTPANVLLELLEKTGTSKRKLSMEMGFTTTSRLYEKLNHNDGLGMSIKLFARMLDKLGYCMIVRKVNIIEDEDRLEYLLDENRMDLFPINAPEPDMSCFDDPAFLAAMGIEVVDE